MTVRVKDTTCSLGGAEEGKWITEVKQAAASLRPLPSQADKGQIPE